MRTPRTGFAALALLVFAAGCTSGHQASAPASTSTSTSVERTQTTKDAAIALAHRMLDRFVPPPGSSITRAATNLLGPYSGVVDGAHLVTQRREWVVDEKPDPTLQFLLAHVPAGFRRFNDFSPTKKGRQFLRWDLREELRPVPLNVDMAAIEIGIVPGDRNLDLTVDARVLWADARPVSTLVPVRDRVVVVSFVRNDPDPHVIRRAVITDNSRVAEIVEAFNSLPRAAPGAPSCPIPPETQITYRLSFATSRGAVPDLVAAMSLSCGEAVGALGLNFADPNFALYNALGPELRAPVS